MAQVTRRFMLEAALGATALAAALRSDTTAAQSRPARSVVDFRRPGDANDSAAFARAIAAGGPIHVPAGHGLGAAGAYLIGDVAPIAGTIIAGDGIGRTVIRPAGDHAAAFFCDSGSATARIGGVRISDMTIEGWTRERGFAEHRHLINLAGVEDARIERVEFKGFQGDGLILSSGRGRPDTERHNRWVRVQDCVFDGVNNENRNGISVIDGDGIWIEGCSFSNCTRANMPCAIDCEPDANGFAIIANITIRRCRFANIGGNAGVIAFHIPDTVRRLPGGIDIIDNVIEHYVGAGATLYLNVNRRLPPDAPAMAIRIRGNRGSAGAWVYNFYAAKGILAQGNIWQDYLYGSTLGFSGPHDLLRDTGIADQFVRCGTQNKVGMYISNVAGLDLSGSAFIDCGDGSANAYAISFAPGRSENVSLQHVTVRSPTGRTRYAVVREAGHRFTVRTNVERDNDFGGLPAVSITD